MSKYCFEFNGKTSENYEIYVEARPEIPGKEKTVSFIDGGKRDESITIDENFYKNVEISLKCSFKMEPDRWNAKRRSLQRWLSGSGELKFSDDPEVFWRVKKVQISKFERPLRKYGVFEIKFTCSPHEYVSEGKKFKAIGDVLFNPYDICYPEYKIAGDGICILAVNGKTMQANVGQNLTINTELMLAYREDGAMMNSSVTGEYENLCLNPGENTISISPGFFLEIKPNWRWR